LVFEQDFSLENAIGSHDCVKPVNCDPVACHSGVRSLTRVAINHVATRQAQLVIGLTVLYPPKDADLTQH
jgi:hypothetical protein